MFAICPLSHYSAILRERFENVLQHHQSSEKQYSVSMAMKAKQYHGPSHILQCGPVAVMMQGAGRYKASRQRDMVLGAAGRIE
jgi:hypothetical protein